MTPAEDRRHHVFQADLEVPHPGHHGGVKYFPAYGRLVWFTIGVRFVSCILMNLIRGEKRVGTAECDPAPDRSGAY